MTTKRRAAITASFALLFVSGLLLTAFGGTPASPYIHERMYLLGESGRIIQGHVGDIIDVQLGDASGSSVWQFGHVGHSAQVTPVFMASMPNACPPAAEPAMRQTSGPDSGRMYTSTQASCATQASQPLAQAAEMARITMVSPGVTTVKGWRVASGAGKPDHLPDFVFIVLVQR
jgi:hypothetical protein